MKTAIQELIEQLELTIPEIINENAIDKTYWIEKEKEQIIDAHCAGQDIEDTSGVSDALEYIEKTFKND